MRIRSMYLPERRFPPAWDKDGSPALRWGWTDTQGAALLIEVGGRVWDELCTPEPRWPS